MSDRRIRSFTEVAPGVHFVEGPASNWTVLTGAGSDPARVEVALIDAGYPEDLALVDESIVRAGARIDDLSTILVTHGHSDHIGTIAPLVARTGARVVGHTSELPNITRVELHQIAIADILPVLWKPRIANWVVHAIRSGGLSDVAVASPVAFGSDVQVDGYASRVVAGHTVLQIPTAGHTPGHNGYLLPEHGVLITGDAIITDHPTTTVTGPQILPPMWHTDAREAVRAIDAFGDLDATVVLPGHGPLLRATPADVVRRVSERLHGR